jgi:hypothetical protein
LDDNVGAMRIGRLIALLAMALACLGVAKAETMSFKKVGNKTIMCMHSGMISELKDCGNELNRYTYVFVGTIAAIKRVKGDESEIQIVPNEVFYGKPGNILTVLTSQGLCFPEFRTGNRWLFYLMREPGKPITLDYYGNNSLPVADARAQIETLRRLKKIGGFGILRGRVARGQFTDGWWISNAHVVATRKADNVQFAAVTDKTGHYEFQPMPSGRYNVAVRPIGDYQPRNSEIDLSTGACWDLTLDSFPNGRIGGHVRRSDGSLVQNVYVVLMSPDNSWNRPTVPDQQGHYNLPLLESGEYVLGLDFPSTHDQPNGGEIGPRAHVPSPTWFYPGVADRSKARVIRLKKDEQLDNLDFTVSAQ